MHTTRREERASRTCGSQLAAFLNVSPSLASASQSLPSGPADAEPEKFGGTWGSSLATGLTGKATSSSRALFAFLTGWFSGLLVLIQQRGSPASSIVFLEYTERAKGCKLVLLSQKHTIPGR